MINLKSLSCLLLILLFVSCGGPKTFYDYDETVNFSEFKSYNFYPEENSGLGEFDYDRFTQALDSLLQEEDYVKSETPDFKINLYAEYFEAHNGTNIGVGIGGVGGTVGGGVSGGIPVGGMQSYISLTVEFAAASNNELFWQGVVENRFDNRMTPDEREEYFMKMAEKTLESYPPK